MRFKYFLNILKWSLTETGGGLYTGSHVSRHPCSSEIIPIALLFSQEGTHLDVASSSSSSSGSRCVMWLGVGLSMPSPNYPVLCCPLPYRVAPVFVQVVSPPLGWAPSSSFLVIWSPSGDARGPSVVFEAVDVPCPGPFHGASEIVFPMIFPWFICQFSSNF